MIRDRFQFVMVLAVMGGAVQCPTLIHAAPSTLDCELPPIPEVPVPQAEDSVPQGDAGSFEEVKLDLPVSPGPFKPTWESIEKNYPGTPDWLREAKFGLWIHFGPQAAGESGDWYARRLYIPGTSAYKNHLKNYGHPSKVGYKDVLRKWNPDKLDPARLVEIYKDAGVRFLIIQGVHHDQFDMWDSKYQPWNSTRLGPKRDLLDEWAKAARKDGIRFGITFHHEYSWWWWQTAFQSDTEGAEAGVPYDGNLTPADGRGTWWEGLDPRLLYGVNLREYKGVARAANSAWSPPPAGIFSNHMAFNEWYAKWWALRMMDAVDKYRPDFIYTDGTDQQPFSGFGTGTGYRCDAMQRVIADFYNKTLARRGKVDVFSIVKFRKKTNGTVNTEEGHIPRGIKTDQDWIGETPVGDWYYGPDFTYSPDAVIRYLLEQVSRDGNVGLCVSLLPDGSIDSGSRKMLKDIGRWMRINGEGIYGSRAWEIPGEGAGGKLNTLPGGKIGGRQANHRFSTSDFRFTVGKDGFLYAWCMTVPKAGEKLCITSLGTARGLLAEPITEVELLGSRNRVKWNQDAEGLHIICPNTKVFKTAVGFRVGPSSIILPSPPTDLTAETSDGKVVLNWQCDDPNAAFAVGRAERIDGPVAVIARDVKETAYTDTSVETGRLYYYTAAPAASDKVLSMSRPVPVLISGEFHYVHETLKGNGSIVAKVESMQPTEAWAKAGLMIRESLDVDARQVIAFVSPTEGIALQGRSDTGGSTRGFAEKGGLSAPHWLKLERKGNLFTAWHSADGREWTALGTATVKMADEVQIGPAVCSHQDGVLCNAVFSRVETTR